MPMLMSIKVQFAHEIDTLKITIQDDGKGYDENKIESGNGINNMKKRAQELDGKISFESDLQKGTKISLIVPIK